MPDSNWDKLKQDIINDIADFKNGFLKSAANDIVDKLTTKGIDGSKIEVAGNKIIYSPTSEDDFESGKIYFEEVFEDISKSAWPETIK